MRIKSTGIGIALGACLIALCTIAIAQETVTLDRTDEVEKPSPRTSDQKDAEPPGNGEGFDPQAHGLYDRYNYHLETVEPRYAGGNAETRRREWRTWKDAERDWDKMDRQYRMSDRDWRTPEHLAKPEAGEYWERSEEYWKDSNRFWESHGHQPSIRDPSPGNTTDPADRTARTPFNSPNDALYDRYQYHRQYRDRVAERTEVETERAADEAWKDWDDARSDWRDFDREWREDDRKWRGTDRTVEGFKDYWDRSNQYWEDSNRFWDTEVRRGPEDRTEPEQP